MPFQAGQPLQAHISARIEQRSAATGRVIEGMCPEIKAYMQAHAAWVDRTGDARRTLQATAVLPQIGGGRAGHSEWELMLWYMVPYGKWLETHLGAAYGHRAGMDEATLMEQGNAGRLAILWPTLMVYIPRVRSMVRAAREST